VPTGQSKGIVIGHNILAKRGQASQSQDLERSLAAEVVR